MALPLVSLLIPVYNVAKYIERCALSVFNQTYTNLEIIFIDDCSPDNSIEILERILHDYPDKSKNTRILKHSKNKGLAGARLTGLLSATGKYILNCDSDDFLAETAVEKLVKLAESSDADIVICDMTLKNGVSDKLIKVNPCLDPDNLIYQIFIGKVHASVCNKLIKRSLYLDNDILPIEGLNMREDLVVMYKLVYHANKINYLPESLYFYDLSNANSYTTSLMSLSAQENTYKLIEDINRFFKDHNMSDTLRNGLLYFKCGLLSLIATYGNLEFHKHYSELFCDVHLYRLLKHPNLDLQFKFFGFLLLFNQSFLINCIRKLKCIVKKKLL